jgi:hypothetical protein
MIDATTRKNLYARAFSLLEHARALLVAARVEHERDLRAEKVGSVGRPHSA